MSKYTFTCEYQDIFTGNPDGNKITLEATEDSLTNVVEAFERFLRGAGFVFDGYLDIVEHDTPETLTSFSMPMPGTAGGAAVKFPDPSNSDKCHRRGCGMTRSQLGSHKCYDEHCGLY